jgi:hypothetical protein
MGSADLERVGVLRDLYRLRYREPCLLPGHEVISLARQVEAMDDIRNRERLTLRFMRLRDTGFEV